MPDNQKQDISFNNRHVELLEKIQELASMDGRDEKLLYKNICEHSMNLVNADHCHIRIADWFEEKLKIKGSASKEDFKIDFEQYLSIGFGEAIGGRVFNTGVPELVNNTQDEGAFKGYFNKCGADTEFFTFLKLIKHSIVVPLFIDKKIVGVLSVLRLKTETDDQNNPFDDNDKKIIELFAKNISLAIHNAWLFNAAIWKLEEDFKCTAEEKKKDEDIKVGDFCKRIIERIKRKIKIDGGQIRFYGWDEKYLVPGTVQWPDSIILDVCELCNLKNSECPQCRAINERKPQIVHNFQTNECVFISKLNKWKEIYQILLTELEKCSTFISDNHNKNEIINFVKQKLQELETKGIKGGNIDSRFNLLINNLNNGNLNKDKFEKILREQITFLKTLSDEWTIYVNDIKKINSEVAVPIFHGSNLIGVLAVYSYKSGWFTGVDEIVLQSLANCVADQVMEYQQQILNKLLMIGQKMTAKWECEDVADTLAKGIKDAVAFYRNQCEEEIYPLLYLCNTLLSPKELVDDQNNFGKHFEYKSRINATVPEKKLGTVPVSNTGLGYKAVQTYKEQSKPVFIVRSNVDDPVNGGSEEARDAEIKTTACLPLIIDDKIYGLLYIHSKKRLFFTKLEKDALILFANQITLLVPGLMDTSTYDATYGTELLIKASSYSQDSDSEKLGFHRKISEILHKSAITGKTQGRAIANLKETARTLVNESNLPNFIAGRYSTYQEEENILFFDAAYRDHFFHPFHTFLLGFSILTELKTKKINNPEISVPLDTDEPFIKKWLLVSLWHDITYPAEKVPEWLSGYILKKLDFDVSITEDCSKILTKDENIKFIENIAKKFNPENKQTTFKTWLLKQLIEWRDHAVLSSILLLKDFFGDKKSKKATNYGLSEEDIYECALSIAIHNFPKAIYNDAKKCNDKKTKKEDSPALSIGSLDIENFKLAFLLSYCDSIQEWGRISVRKNTEHIKFIDIKPETEYEIKAILSFNINKYIEIKEKSIGAGKLDMNTAKDELIKEWQEKCDSLLKAWTHKSKWRFTLTQQFLYNQKDAGTNPYDCCTYQE